MCTRRHVATEKSIATGMTILSLNTVNLFDHLYAYYLYSGCHAKIGKVIAEKFDVPHIALK
jgi:hypothetical protein